MGKWCWCLVKEDNSLSTGWQLVGGDYYYFYPNGQMSCNEWLHLGNEWFKIDETGKMITGWYQENNKWYYLETQSNGHKGAMYSKGKFSIEYKDYTFNEDGSLFDGNYVSDKCVEFVKVMEGFFANKYDDGCGVITQGYGCTGEEISSWGNSVTEEEASKKLIDLLNNKYAPLIKAELENKGVNLKQNEIDALISMAYNIGTGGVIGSTLFKDICSGVKDETKITREFQAWSKGEINGVLTTIKGLYKRRTLEANMFLNGDYSVE